MLSIEVDRLDRLIIETTKSTAKFNLMLLKQDIPLCISDQTYLNRDPKKGLDSFFDSISYGTNVSCNELRTNLITFLINNPTTDLNNQYWGISRSFLTHSTPVSLLADLQANRLRDAKDIFVYRCLFYKIFNSRNEVPYVEFDQYMYSQSQGLVSLAFSNDIPGYNEHRDLMGIKMCSFLCDTTNSSPDEYIFWQLDRLDV